MRNIQDQSYTKKFLSINSHLKRIIYWKQLYTRIESYGMEAVQVNPLFTKNMRNRKPSDLADSQWIYKLHTTGLLPQSFQPGEDVEQLRTLARHRKQIIEDSSRCVNKMQKSLILMNIQLPTIISDIMGVSGKAIVNAILSGEGDAKVLVSLVKTKLQDSPENPWLVFGKKAICLNFVKIMMLTSFTESNWNNVMRS